MAVIQKLSESVVWAIFGALICGIGWLAFMQGIIVIHAGNIFDSSNMLNSAPIFGAVAMAFLFAFRHAQVTAEDRRTKIAVWRQVSLLVLGCGVLILAAVRVYRVLVLGDDVASTMILAAAWALIGVLIGWFIGNKKRFKGLLRR